MAAGYVGGGGAGRRRATVGATVRCGGGVRSGEELEHRLDEARLEDGASLDDDFGGLGGWIAATLVQVGDDGLIHRLDEWINPAPLAPLFE